MYSDNLGASWDFVAKDVHPFGVTDYLTSDFVWLVVIVVQVHVLFVTVCYLCTIGVSLASTGMSIIQISVTSLKCIIMFLNLEQVGYCVYECVTCYM